MQLRAGYELIYSFPQPTPMILVVNVHHSRAADLVVPDLLDHGPSGSYLRLSRFFRELVQPAGRARRASAADRRLRDQRLRFAGRGDAERLAGLRCRTCPKRRWCSCSAAATAKPICCPIPRGSSSATRPGLSPRAGYLRLRPQPHRVQLSERPRHAHRLRSVQRTNRRLPRLRASRDRLLPLPEYSRALLHRISGRRGNAAAVSAGRFRRMVRSVDRRPLAHLRSAQQCAAQQPRSDGARPRRLPMWRSPPPSAPTCLKVSGLDRRSTMIVGLMSLADGPPFDSLPLQRTGWAGRTSHDVPSARELRSAADRREPDDHAGTCPFALAARSFR